MIWKSLRRSAITIGDRLSRRPIWKHFIPASEMIGDDLRTAIGTVVRAGFHMIYNGRRHSAISICRKSASCPRHMETLKRLSGTLCDIRSEWSEELYLILLSRPLRPRRQRNVLIGTRKWDNRRHIIFSLKSRVSNCPMRTETFATHFEPGILRFVRLLDLRSPTKYRNTCVVSATHQFACRRSPTVIADRRRPLQMIWKPGFTCFPRPVTMSSAALRSPWLLLESESRSGSWTLLFAIFVFWPRCFQKACVRIFCSVRHRS